MVTVGNEEQRQARKNQVSVSEEERLLVSAVQFLIDGHEEDAARVLLSCSLRLHETDRKTWARGGVECTEVVITLAGPRAVYDILDCAEHPITRAIWPALQAVAPDLTCVGAIMPRVERIDIDANWRSQVLERVRGKGVHNQGAEIHAGPLFTWKNLRFQSQSEVCIAQALERAGALFLPNCMAHLQGLDGPENKEADFLVCHHGKWGVLEVDGEPFHPPPCVALDHARDRLFRAHGIKVVEHFPATECYNEPGSVVGRFLEILMKA